MVLTPLILVLTMVLGIPYVYVYARNGVRYLRKEFGSKELL